MVEFFKGKTEPEFQVKPRNEFVQPLNPMELEYATFLRSFRKPTTTVKNPGKVDKNKIIHVMSYNILADHLAKQRGDFWHTHASDAILDITYRAPRIMEELKSSDASIICFQEMSYAGDFYEPNLNEIGFQLIRHEQYKGY